ncbi:MAG: DUF1987 domain-containing protein [Crocinitomicaceae bacterium]|nr:DUF1987 domain-containing protein [Crocinitomicaceae bacterium]
MEQLKLESSPSTPLISFDPVSGEMYIEGRAIPEDPDAFWMPVISWFESYMHKPAANTVFKVKLEYFNTSSSKRILFLLHKLNALVKEQNFASVEWYYRQEDEEMFEIGNDYAYMVKVPFEFIVFDAEIA